MSITQTAPPEVYSLSGEQNLVPQQGHLRTLDIGSNGITISTNLLGDILQLGCFHPLHGVVLACPFGQFDGDRFYDPIYVREYRKTLLNYVLSGTRGFGIHVRGIVSHLKHKILDDKSISIMYSTGRAQIATNISVCQDRGVVQSTTLISNSRQTVDVDYDLALNVSVNRASYGQLTEGGPIPIPQSRNEFQLFDRNRTWAVTNRNLDAMIQGSLSCDGLPVSLDSIVVEKGTPDRPVDVAFHGTVRVRPGHKCTLVSAYQLHAGTELSKAAMRQVATVPKPEESWMIKNNKMRLVIKGNLSYIIGNCAIPVDENSTCFIADHVALPLGWNRDNYWQIRYLLDVHRNIDRLAGLSTAQDCRVKIQILVRRHLNWVFWKAQRPHGYWHRSYLATGVPKDGPVYQQDQQCYPILELCDFLDHFPLETAFVKSLLAEEAVSSVLATLDAHQDPATGLYTTEETPGDDAVQYPFHFSSQILLWHTFSRLANTLSKLDFVSDTLNPTSLKQKAERLRQSTLQHFIAQNPTTNTTMFAYLTDGAGVHTFYHDANDIPTLFIPLWNFASPSSPEYALWSRTMAFGLSPLNTEGYFPNGPYGGLGSVHTRGPWPLGFAQEFVYANLVGDGAASADAWRRIQGSMFWDGLFSEAVDAQTGECVSKAWFSWPGSMIGSALLRFGVPGEERL